MKIIGLTGGIASGKSTVSRMLKELGAQIIDADIISREIVEPGEETLCLLVNEFGNTILDENGALNRKHLGNIVFQSPEKLKSLNGILHPRIKKVIHQRIDEIGKDKDADVVVVDAALLLESGMYDMVDEVWLVYAERDIQIKRLMERDNISFDEALSRINCQMPVEDKIAMSDVVIDNSGDIETTEKKVNECWANIMRSIRR